MEKIAEALGVNRRDLFVETEEGRTLIVRRDERPHASSTWSRAHIEAIGLAAPLPCLFAAGHPEAAPARRRPAGPAIATPGSGREGVMNKVIFACLHNAGRSQMAAAFFNALADPAKARAISAGTRPGVTVHPEVLAVMRESGIDLSAAKPQLLTPGLAAGARHLVTMGCGEECPYLPGLSVQDWPLEDPKGRAVERVREIRDDIRDRVERFIEAQGWAARPASKQAT